MPPRVQPGNPDWVEWVEQLAAKSEERGEKSAQTFKRAAQSLRSCPLALAFQHPEDALQLKGVGPKIVQHITRKLKEKCEAEGVEMPDRVPSPSKPRGRPAASKSKKRPALDDDDPTHNPRYARRLKAMGIDPADAAAAGPSGQQFAPGLTFQAHPDGHAWYRPQTPEDDEPRASRGKGKGKGKAKAADDDGEKEKKERAYIPRQNSGAYAILLALYKCSAYGDRYNDAGEGGAGSAESWVTKQMIMDVGQEFSTTPFDTGTANRGGNATGGPAFTYSAWSGNTTRQEKGLMIASNKRPIKYCVTAAGYTLAEKLAPSAGIAVHKAPARSSSAAHPSSSGARGATHPSSSGGGIGGDPFASLGRGNVVGGPGSGVRPPQGIHPAPRRRRSETPEFLRVPADDPARAATEEAEDPALNFEDDDPEFAAQMRQALALSRQESQSFSSSPAPARATGAALDPAAVARRVAGGATSSKAGDAALARLLSSSGAGLDGRKAASGMYAVKAARPEKEPAAGGIGNYDAAFGYFYLTEELPGGKTKEAYMKERVSAEKAPGFPDAAMRGGKAPPEAKGKGKEKERDPDPVKALLAGFKAPEKRSRDAMYEAPKEPFFASGGLSGSTPVARQHPLDRPHKLPSSPDASPDGMC
ncbi:Crossover junction endonuclease mus81 [Rhodosporidiobolus nylandii]